MRPLREIAPLPPKKPGPTCGVGKLLTQLTEDDVAVLREWLASDHDNVWVSDMLRAGGYDISDFTVGRHKNGRCKCR